MALTSDCRNFFLKETEGVDYRLCGLDPVIDLNREMKKQPVPKPAASWLWLFQTGRIVAGQAAFPSPR